MLSSETTKIAAGSTDTFIILGFVYHLIQILLISRLRKAQGRIESVSLLLDTPTTLPYLLVSGDVDSLGALELEKMAQFLRGCHGFSRPRPHALVLQMSSHI